MDLYLNAQAREKNQAVATICANSESLVEASYEPQNWNCSWGVYPRSLRWAAMVLFMGGGPHLNIYKIKWEKVGMSIWESERRQRTSFKLTLISGAGAGKWVLIISLDTNPTPPFHVSGGWGWNERKYWIKITKTESKAQVRWCSGSWVTKKLFLTEQSILGYAHVSFLKLRFNWRFEVAFLKIRDQLMYSTHK